MPPISSKPVDVKAMYLLVDHPKKLPLVFGPFGLSHQRDMTAVSIHTDEENEPIESDLFMLNMMKDNTIKTVPYPHKFFEFLHCDKAWFTIEDGKKFPGYTDGAHWNGWAMPYFTREVAEQVLAYFGSPNPEGTDNDDYEGYVFKEEESSIIIDPETRKPIQVWAIGSGGWCWEECSPDDKEMDE